MRIVSVDPGGTTGIAIWTDGVWSFNELGPSPHHYALYWELSELNHQEEINLLLCEGFDNRANPAAQLISLEYIGVCKLFAEVVEVPIHLPKPSEKEWTDDKKLSVLGLRAQTVSKPHARDASRHLVNHLINKLPRHQAVIRMFEQLRTGLT